MTKLKVGVLVDNLGLGVRRGIERAAELGLDGVQVYCTSGEMHPDSLSRSGRRDLRRFLERKGLALSALCADFLRGFKDPDANDRLVPETAKCLALARELGAGVVTTHLGSVPEDEADPGRRAMTEALRDLAREAERQGVSFAAETGAEPPERLKGLLDSLGLGPLKVNLDPANLTRRGWSAVEAVEALAPYLVHAHAKDAKAGGEGDVPLGEGDVPWEEYLASLEAAEFHGFHAIERESGRDREGDVARAVEFLRRF
jgi:sugar phosphate isomerase/epimerase